MYYIIYTDWKCVKVQKKGSKYIYVAMVTDNLNWWLIAIKFQLFFYIWLWQCQSSYILPQEPLSHCLTSRVYPKERWITNGPLISNKSLKVSKLTCFNDIISPEKTKSLQTSIQGFYKLFISTRLECLWWFSTFGCFEGGFMTIQGL